MFRRKKNKSHLEQLSGQLDKDGLILRDVANGASRPTRMVAPAGVERFSDDEDDMMPMLNAAYVWCCGNWHCSSVFCLQLSHATCSRLGLTGSKRLTKP